MKKNIVAVFYCLMMCLQAIFCLCACETMEAKGNNDVLSASVNEQGQLVLTLENGELINVGVVVGGDGLNGKDGENGRSAYELYIEAYPDYQGTEEEWLADLAEGNLKDKSYTYGLSYSILPDGTLGVSVGTAGRAEEIVIPATHDGYTVTKILDYAFSGNTDIVSVVLPNTITSIGAGAFRCCVNLESVILPASVKEIGVGAFDYCTKLNVTDLRPEMEKTN